MGKTNLMRFISIIKSDNEVFQFLCDFDNYVSGAERTFFLNSGFPFLTVATNMSPTPAAGNLLRRPRIPLTAMTNKFLPPESRHDYI